jgi:hypothetical protein
MRKLGSIFEKNNRFKNIINDKDVFKTLHDNWGLFLGKLSKDMILGFYKKKIVFIEAKNHMWVNEVNFYKAEIIKKINDFFKKKVVVDIKVSKGIVEKKLKEEPRLKSRKLNSTSLKEKILEMNIIKKQAGFKLCKECKEIFTDDVVCVFCKKMPT